VRHISALVTPGLLAADAHFIDDPLQNGSCIRESERLYVQPCSQRGWKQTDCLQGGEFKRESSREFKREFKRERYITIGRERREKPHSQLAAETKSTQEDIEIPQRRLDGHIPVLDGWLHREAQRTI
jgi:hypothetical protein